MEVAAVVEAVADVPQPHISPDQGTVLYEHIRRTRPERALELGTARGVSAAYIAAAMEANSHGQLVTVDSSLFPWSDPSPREVLGPIGLLPRVTLDRRFTTYTWFLKEELVRCSDDNANCTPEYDFCFLDGSKNWTIDGLAVLLMERLLRPGGWLLLDDLDWRYSDKIQHRDEHYFVSLGHLSYTELNEPHIRAVFDLIIRPHPSFTEMVIQNEWWAWARKAPGEPRRLHIETTKTARSYALDGARRVRRGFRRLGREAGAVRGRLRSRAR